MDNVRLNHIMCINHLYNVTHRSEHSEFVIKLSPSASRRILRDCYVAEQAVMCRTVHESNTSDEVSV